MKSKIFGIFVCLLLITAGITSIIYAKPEIKIIEIKSKNEIRPLGRPNWTEPPETSTVRDEIIYAVPFSRMECIVGYGGCGDCSWQEVNYTAFRWTEGPCHNDNSLFEYKREWTNMGELYASNGDWDGDGLDDIVYVRNEEAPPGCDSTFYIYEADGGFSTWDYRRVLWIGFGNCDNDPEDEILFMQTYRPQAGDDPDHKYSFRWRDQDGSINIFPNNNPGYVYASNGDWDGDGIDDIAVLQYQNEATNIYLVEADGGVTSWMYQNRSYKIDFGDMDQDGLDEIIYVERGNKHVEEGGWYWYDYNYVWKDQDGTKNLLGTIFVEPDFLCSNADYDGDGKDDYMWAHKTADGWVIHINEIYGYGEIVIDKMIAPTEVLFVSFCDWDNPPYAENPSPVHMATNVSVDVDFSWDVGDPDSGDTFTYDFYLFPKANPEDQIVVYDLDNPFFDPETLKEGTYYVWRIEVEDNKGMSNRCLLGEWCFTTTCEPQNLPPVFSDENPSNNAVDIDVDLCTLNVYIADPEGDNFDWSIETSPDIGGCSETNDVNGTKICGIESYQLDYDTTYTWYVNATDAGSGQWTREIYTFTTESEGIVNEILKQLQIFFEKHPMVYKILGPFLNKFGL